MGGFSSHSSRGLAATLSLGFVFVGFLALGHVPARAAFLNRGDIVVAVSSFDSQLLRIDPLTGERTLLSGFGRGAGPALRGSVNVRQASDGSLLVTDAFAWRVFRIDPETGDREIVSQAVEEAFGGSPPGWSDHPNVGTGPDFVLSRPGSLVELGGAYATDVLETPTSQLFVVAEAGLFKIDPGTGDRTLLSGPSLGSGPVFGKQVLSLALAANGEVYVSDYESASILRVHPSTGDRSILSSNAVGTGPSVNRFGHILLDSDGSLLASYDGGILRIDPITGNRELIPGSDSGFAGGLAWLTPSKVVTTNYVNSVSMFDLDSGQYTLISGPFGGGVQGLPIGVLVYVPEPGTLVMALVGVAGLALVGFRRSRKTFARALLMVATLFAFTQDSARAAFLNRGDIVVANIGVSSSLYRVDPVTGERTLLSGTGRGTGFPVTAPISLRQAADGSILISNFGSVRVMKVVPESGNRTIVSQAGEFFGTPTIGAGPNFADYSGPLLPVWFSSILERPDGQLLMIAENGLFQVDPASGDRTILSGVGIGSGPMVSRQMLGIELAPNGEVLVADFGQKAIFRVDPLTGDRQIVADATTGSGPSLDGIGYLTYDVNGNLLAALGGSTGKTAGIIRIDPATGDREYLPGSQSDAIGGFGMMGLAPREDGTLVVSKYGSTEQGIYIFDPVAQAYTLLSNAGPDFPPGAVMVYVPEPGTWTLALCGVLALVCARRRTTKRL